jgi:uncharacterized protein YjiS (DUF1127 family)
MTCTQSTSIARTVYSAPTLRAASKIRAWWRAYWLWRAREATITILHRLDQRTLRDIGIDPSEIRSVVYSKLRDRRPEYDETWRWR